MVEEAIQSQWNIEALIVSTDYLSQFVSIDPGIHTWAADPQDFKKISQQNNPEGIIAIVTFPYPDFSYSRDLDHLPSGPGFLLDGIQDPGNLGTIMRIADWFGFPNVICGPGTVDLLNPKTLRSSMGAIFRVNMIYAQNFPELVKNHSQEIKIADMNGENPNQTDWNKGNYILIGNEANGVSESIRQIPGLSFVSIPGSGNAESLNAAISAGILGYALYNNLL